MHNLKPEDHPDIVKHLYAQMGQMLKEIDDPWYKKRILSNMIPY